MITISLETLDEIRRNADELLADHWRELSTNKTIMRLNPNWDAYEALMKDDCFFILGMRDQGELVGYSCNIITNHLHYRDLRVCYNDVLFVAKKYRKHGDGLKLIEATEMEAKKRDCRLMLWHAKPNTALHDLLPNMDYRVQEIMFSKEI